METRANHVLIGAFTLGGLLSLFFFALWIVKTNIDQEHAEYDILFEGAVNGLGNAGAVSYKGVNVGEVTNISINEANPNQIRVHIRVDAATPVYADSIAKIEYQGVTGVGFVQITGGSPTMGALPIDPLTGYPVIPSEDSDLQAIFASAPEIMSQVISLLDQVRSAISEENMAAVAGTLENIETITASFANRGSEIEEMLTNFSAASEDLKGTISNINRISGTIDEIALGANQLMNVDVPASLAEAQETLASVDRLAGELADAIEAAQPAIEDFSAGGARDLNRLMVEIRQSGDALNRLIERLESDAPQTLFGDGETR